MGYPGESLEDTDCVVFGQLDGEVADVQVAKVSQN